MANQFFNEYKSIISDYEDDFEIFRTKYYKLIEENFPFFEKNFNNLSSKYKPLLEKGQRNDDLSSLEESIQILSKIKKSEENILTKFIFELLNTQGKHNQKDLFYKLFINQIVKDNAEIFINEKYYHYIFKNDISLNTPKYQKNNSLMVISKSPAKRFVILLINNWNNNEEYISTHVTNLNNILNNKAEYKHKNFLIIYLTNNRKKPKLNELTEKENTVREYKYLYITSFNDNIKKWLNNCQSACKSKDLNNVIEQFKKIYYEFCN